MSGLILLSVILFSSCRKEIQFEGHFDESLYYLNGVIGVGESPEFSVGAVTRTADTFHIDFNCAADIRLISTGAYILDPVNSQDGRCMYINPEITINPQTAYTVQASIDGHTLTSEIETPQVHPYNFSLSEVKYLGESSISKIVNGEIIKHVAKEYQVSFEALYSGEGVPGPNVGISLEFDSDSTVITDSDVIGRETMRPRIFQKIDELIIDNRANRQLEVIMKVKMAESLDSITLMPVVWMLDNPFYDYLLSYDVHTRSVTDPFSVPARMYSNVEKGVGIFGSYSRSIGAIKVKLPE